MAVAVRKARARAFEALHQSRDVIDRRQLEEEVDVVGNDADLDDTRAVTFRFPKQEGRKERCDRLVDEWHSTPTGPGEVSIEVHGHGAIVSSESHREITQRAHHASLRTRAVAEPAL